MIRLTGCAHAQTMYVDGDDPLDVSVESLGLESHELNEEPGLYMLASQCTGATDGLFVLDDGGGGCF